MWMGIILSLLTMFFWALSDVLLKVASVHFAVHPVLFISLTSLVSSLVLLLIAGSGTRGINTLRSVHTWAYGMMDFLLYLSQMFALAFVTATVMNFMNRLTIPLSLLMSFMFLHRKPGVYDLVGVVPVMVGLWFIASHIPDTIQVQAMFWLVFSAVASTICAMIGETHPESMAADDIPTKARVTGYVVMACSACFLLAMWAMAAAKAAMPDAMPGFGWVPTYDDFLNPSTFLFAVALGFTVMPFALYFFFQATRVAKNEVFMMISSLLPFMTFAMEWLFSKAGLLDINQLKGTDLIFGMLIVGGALVMVYGRHIRADKP